MRLIFLYRVLVALLTIEFDEFNWNSNFNDRYLYRNQQLATVIGVSGIAPIGKKQTAEYNSLLKGENFLKIVYLNIPAQT